MKIEQVLPKVIWEDHVATTHGRKCTHPLCVLAVQCPVHITQLLSHGYATSIPLQYLDTSVPKCNLYSNPIPYFP